MAHLLAISAMLCYLVEQLLSSCLKTAASREEYATEVLSNQKRLVYRKPHTLSESQCHSKEEIARVQYLQPRTHDSLQTQTTADEIFATGEF